MVSQIEVEQIRNIDELEPTQRLEVLNQISDLFDKEKSWNTLNRTLFNLMWANAESQVSKEDWLKLHKSKDDSQIA